jgi:dTDP-4-dehydrorhamnose reductase
MATKSPYCKPEIWGGIECTINRIGNDFRDQLDAAGHYSRPGDIEQFAALGIRKLRYPVLWERHQPVQDQEIDWKWTTRQLELIRSHNITPVAGLVHHGSGPAYTSLLDEEFPVKLAAYALEVAAKFPWIECYTPVNEPLTTARFSGLYGFWYPHHREELSFAKILLNQVKGIVLSMQAIRTINPLARLVQTEDLSKTHSTRLLSYQAQFENKRRWLTYDLLCGKINRRHFFWNYFISLGIPEKDLQFFLDNKCPPQIMGFNYYVTSERYIDENLEKYPSSTHGGNGRHHYADTEAVRNTGISLEALLKEAWHRYYLPLAITECHLNCTREEQLRWFKETWDTACRLNEEGINITAVTAWSLLGAYDWNTLLTANNHHYEAGVFDVSNHMFRPTALAKQIKALAASQDYTHPLLSEKGWWHRVAIPHTKSSSAKHIPVLITGSNGTLGKAFARICQRRSIPHIALSKQELNISNRHDIEKAIDAYKPWAVINAAGYVRVDDAEIYTADCMAANAYGPGLMAEICREKGIRLMSFSSDLVFDGMKKSPYHETDDINPLNIYGASKAKGEDLVKAADPSALIIRTSAFFGPWDQYNFVFQTLQSLKNGLPVEVANDVMVSPTYVPDLADAALDLFIDEEKGIWHLSNQGMLTWNDFACQIAERGGFGKYKIMARPLQEMGWKARRPLYSVLQSKKGINLPLLDNAVQRYFEEQHF